MDDAGRDAVAPAGTLDVVDATPDVDINPPVAEDAAGFGCVGYNGNIGFAVVLSAVGLDGVGTAGAVTPPVALPEKTVCSERGLVVLMVLAGLAPPPGFKMLNIFA